jgi:AraC-like DNA-binding protein
MIQALGHIVDLLIGFSLFAALTLWIAYLFFLPNLRKSVVSKFLCTLLLSTLCALQLYHYQVWASPPTLLTSNGYLLLLLLLPPAFYLFSRAVLLPDVAIRPWHALHFAPALSSVLLSSSTVLIVAFAIGAGYALWFVWFVYGMRRAVKRFRFEMFFFGGFAVQATLVFLLALSLPYISHITFHLIYASFTGVALLLINATLIVFPEVVDDLATVARLAYAKSTLDNVDVGAVAGRLTELMESEKVYRDEDLNLSMVAEALEISGHQLSELINTRFGQSFSSYVRRIRVAEAQQLLAEDAKSSVLSISMATGFRSQSNFYAAFGEVTGESPGAYRKRIQGIDLV